MVSRNRKKNKGKERKAKKYANLCPQRVWWKWATGDEQFVGKTITCDHGCGELSLSAVDQPVLSFMHKFFGIWNKKVITYVMLDTFKTHPQVWNDNSYKKMAMNIFTRMGTNILLNEDENIALALTLARALNLLEHYDGRGNLEVVISSRVVATKIRDISDGKLSSSRRAGLKFFSKRTTCSCLKAMHQEARKTTLKMGRCYGCEQEKERVALSVCSRCMVEHYCSRECQVADWSRHERYCHYT